MKRIYPYTTTEQDEMLYAYPDGTPATKDEWLDQCRRLKEEEAEFDKKFGTSRVIREIYEDCDLHRALMNTGYAMYRKDFYYNGRYTGRVVDYYAPKADPREYQRDWTAEPRYKIGRGGNAYPAEFLEMYPYSYGGW